MGTANTLDLQKMHHKTAFEFISMALHIDESNGNVSEAINLYKKGMDALEMGLSLEIEGEDSRSERAQELQRKMLNNMCMCQERVDALQQAINKKDKSQLSINSALSKSKSSTPSSSKPSSKTTDSIRSHNNASKQSSERRTTSLDRRVVPGRKAAAARAGATNTNSSLRSVNPAEVKGKKTIKFKNIDKHLQEVILNEILDQSLGIQFSDISGQDSAKQALREMVILPSIRPELFTGLRSPAKGLLLFGPPGCGKTLLAKAIATESKATFFSISASTLTSKWVGEGEKLVKALFQAASQLQPSVVFIDEVDSLLSARREGEQDHSRRLKTEFLVQFDGVGTVADERVLVMGATNRPQELDEAVLRRFSKRVYITMPDVKTRHSILQSLLSKHGNPLSNSQLDRLARETDGYSGSDLTSLAKDAALGPIRDIPPQQVASIEMDKVRDISMIDFDSSLRKIRPSVNQSTLSHYTTWNQQYGDTSAS